jgi:uncharacterized protein (TIGR03118 family)
MSLLMRTLVIAWMQPSSPGSSSCVSTPGDATHTGVNPNTNKSVTARAPFLFATLDGTISGWSPGVNPTNAVIAKNRSDVGAIYTGLAVASNSGQNYLYAADDGPNRRVDVFDKNFGLVEFSPNAFIDTNIPQKFAPYGIQTICQESGCNVWVTYTALDKAQSGFVDEFTTDGTLVHSFALQGPLHSPWGVTLAPANFGPMSSALLISNNTSRGRIDAFDPSTGAFLGSLRDPKGKIIEIDQLWGIRFGLGGGANGNVNQLFFTAGSNEYGDGLFGAITIPQ